MRCGRVHCDKDATWWVTQKVPDTNTVASITGLCDVHTIENVSAHVPITTNTITLEHM